MELLDPLARTFDHTTAVLRGVEPSDLDRPTPCAEWDLRALVTHMLGVVVNMGHGANGEPLVAEADIDLDDDLAAQFRAAADGTLAGFRSHGPGDSLDVGGGQMPVGVAMGINLLDTTTHAWDIARATGQATELPDDLATTALEVARGIVLDERRAKAGFAPPVVVDEAATPTDRLVAFLGRTP